ncbi:MAG: sigma-70 family RNA polymerase sigma factor [Anaerolineae bacterium]|jgi:RNA polymerase sigma-70 factor (ECF subfamily)
MDGHGSQTSTGNDKSRKRDDGRLVERAQNGDEKAVGELYRRHVDTIYRYIYARTQDEVVAEDLTAQVFLKALEGLPTYQYMGKPFLSWLYRIAYARVVDHYREQRRRQEVALFETVPADDPPPSQRVEAEAESDAAIDLLAQLTDDQQDVLILRFIGELSLAEVAETLGKTVGAIKALQHRALASLARLQQE